MIRKTEIKGAEHCTSMPGQQRVFLLLSSAWRAVLGYSTEYGVLSCQCRPIFSISFRPSISERELISETGSSHATYSGSNTRNDRHVRVVCVGVLSQYHFKRVDDYTHEGTVLLKHELQHDTDAITQLSHSRVTRTNLHGCERTST